MKPTAPNYENREMNSTQKTSPVASLQELLKQTRNLLQQITDEQYTLSVTNNASGVGAHIRHTLDHIRALLNSRQGSVVDYDSRERNTIIERSRSSAIQAIDEIINELDEISDRDLHSTVELQLLVAPFQPRYTTTSTIGRELAFVLHHAIHHNAMIASIVRSLGIEVPAFFGFAPATIEVLS